MEELSSRSNGEEFSPSGLTPACDGDTPGERSTPGALGASRGSPVETRRSPEVLRPSGARPEAQTTLCVASGAAPRRLVSAALPNEATEPAGPRQRSDAAALHGRVAVLGRPEPRGSPGSPSAVRRPCSALSAPYTRGRRPTFAEPNIHRARS